MKIAPDAEPDDGVFDVLLIGDISKRDLVLTMPKIFRGTHLPHPKAELLRGARVTVDAPEPLPIELDGEQPGTTPARFEVVPQALRSESRNRLVTVSYPCLAPVRSRDARRALAAAGFARQASPSPVTDSCPFRTRAWHRYAERDARPLLLAAAGLARGGGLALAEEVLRGARRSLALELVEPLLDPAEPLLELLEPTHAPLQLVDALRQATRARRAPCPLRVRRRSAGSLPRLLRSAVPRCSSVWAWPWPYRASCDGGASCLRSPRERSRRSSSRSLRASPPRPERQSARPSRSG